MAACGSSQNENCDDCVQIIRNTRTVQVPCTRNTYKQYTVKVPRQVTEQVPRTVQYTDFESRQKQVPYTDYRSERRTRMETQTYQVPVTTTHTKMIPVTKKVPKTVYVDVTTQVPRAYQRTTMQTRERQVPVPYYVNVPETKYRTVTEQVPVQKSRVQMDSVVKTVYDTQVRTRVVPETKIVTKQIPVFNVVAKPPAPCPTGADCGSGDVVADFSRNEMDGNGQFSNNESVGEYAADAQAVGNFGNTVGFGHSGYENFASGNSGFMQSSGDDTAATGNTRSITGYGQSNMRVTGNNINDYGVTSHGSTVYNRSAPATHGADAASMYA